MVREVTSYHVDGTGSGRRQGFWQLLARMLSTAATSDEGPVFLRNWPSGNWLETEHAHRGILCVPLPRQQRLRARWA